MASSRDHYSSSFPTVPASLSVEDDHGMRDHYVSGQEQTHAPRDYVHSLEELTPYLGLRARLSQVWLNKWTILILLVLARVLIAIGNLHDDIDVAEAKALSACTQVEAMGSTLASMPHYLAEGTNELAAKTITKTVDGLEDVLFMAITAVEQIFLFVINMMYGTYECLITFAVTGTAHVAISLIEDATTAINNTIDGLTNDINNAAESFTKDLNTFLQGISDVATIFGGSVNPPTLSIGSQLDSLKNIQIPSSINDELNKINASIPTFDEVHNFTNQVLSLPFEEVKTLLNQTLGVYNFNQSLFSVPDKQSLVLCTADANEGITDFFDGLYTVADIARKVFIGVLLTMALLACVPFAMLEIRRWRKMNERTKLVRAHAREPMDVIYIVSRPITAGVGLSAARRFGSPKRQVLTRWFIAYITSTPALLVLAVALAGLFSCLCQYILLKTIEKEVPALATQVGAFADKVVDALNNASTTWANHTNTAIIAENDIINYEVFGWVNTTTSALNNTLDAFINQTTTVIQKAFGGGPLEDPVQQIFNCLIGLKVEAIQRGLTWAQDNAHVDFPLFPDDIFSAGASKSLAASSNSTGINSNGDSFLSNPGSDATDAITGAVIDLTDKLASGIRTEALISTAVLMAYILVILLGAAWTLFRCCSARSNLRGNGAISYAGDIDLDEHEHGAPTVVNRNLDMSTAPSATGLNGMPTGGLSSVATGALGRPVVRTAAASAYNWSEKERVTSSAALRQEQGVVGSYADGDDVAHHTTGVTTGSTDEKRGYPAF